MKSPTALEDVDDIFGPPRTDYCAPKNRPSIMISGTYRQKEERKRILKISSNKLKKIDDPDSSLCRSVLINNTTRRLHKEARDEKLRKHQLHYYNEKNVDNLPIKRPRKNIIRSDDNKRSFYSLDHKVPSEDTSESENHRSSSTELVKNPSFEILEDYDLHNLLSQFYMQPTPRLITSIDDPDDNVIDEPSSKRSRLENIGNENNVGSCANMSENDSSMLFLGQDLEREKNTFTCGQALMLSEIQNAFHSLITSLET